jgi:hypothetical protein
MTRDERGFDDRRPYTAILEIVQIAATQADSAHLQEKFVRTTVTQIERGNARIPWPVYVESVIHRGDLSDCLAESYIPSLSKSTFAF